MSKKVLITGTSGGFGKLTAVGLLQKGYTVVASMRNIKGKNKAVAAELAEAGAHIVEIDVTSDESVETGVAAAIEKADGLDVVVNNAGVGVLGLQENFTPDDWRNLFDVNVFGVQRVNRAVLPHFREKNDGLLIHISSLLGRMTLPFYGPYNASKWAVEALAETYRVELSGLGVDVAIVEPGGYPTDFFGNLWQPTDMARQKTYGDMADAPMQLVKSFEGAFEATPEQKPQDVADAVIGLIETPAGERPFRTPVDKMGMGDLIDKYNDHLEQVTSGIYGNFGMGDMLKLKVS